MDVLLLDFLFLLSIHFSSVLSLCDVKNTVFFGYRSTNKTNFAQNFAFILKMNLLFNTCLP